jgi:hypothetical protein
MFSFPRLCNERNREGLPSPAAQLMVHSSGRALPSIQAELTDGRHFHSHYIIFNSVIRRFQREATGKTLKHLSNPMSRK